MAEQKSGGKWRFSGAELDQGVRELRVDGELVELEPKSFDLLLLLLEHAGEVVTTEEFLEGVWPGRIVADTAVQNLVSKLRKALRDDEQAIIKTIPKVGYRLVASVEYLAPRPTAAPALEFKAGDTVSGREQWRLVERLQGAYAEVWVSEHSCTREKRVFKFCIDNERLSSLKREVTLHRLLRDALGDRDDFVHILEWNFETPPYFIESAYAGIDLKRWVESKGGAATLAPAERIGLVIRIGEALAAAHSIGILHKDLKPQNILVEEDNGRRIVRLGDFGAGRLLDAGKLGEFGITRLGFTQTAAVGDSTSGTLMYMAPELLSNGVPSVQSDIYSVGVILYQLVAGDLDKLMAPGWEADIADELLLEDIRDATFGSRDRRLSSIQQLVDRLTTLEQRRARIHRQQQEHLQAQHAIEALNRAKVRRPWLVAAALLLVAGAIVSTYFFQRARVEAKAALEQAQRTEALNDFLTSDILRAASSRSGGRPDISLLDAIKQSIPRVEQRFTGKPDLETTVDRALGDLLSEPYDEAAALREYQREAALETQLYGAADPRTLDTQVHIADSLKTNGKGAEGRALFDRIYPLLKAAVPADDRRLLNARYVETRFSLLAGNVDQTLALIRPLREDCRRYLPNSELTERVEISFLSALSNTGRFAEKEKEARALIRERTNRYGANDFRTVSARAELGPALAGEGKYDEAEQEIKTTLALMIKAVGQDHAQVRVVEGDLSDLYEERGRWNDSVPYRKLNYESARNEDGDGSLWTIETLYQYANTLDMAGRAVEAVPLARKACDTASRTLSSEPGNVVLANTRMVLAQSLIDAGRVKDALPVVKEFGTIVDGKSYEGNWPYKGMAELLQAEMDVSSGDKASARRLATEAKTLFDKGGDNQDSASATEFLKKLDAGTL